jgi:hypothetical protein
MTKSYRNPLEHSYTAGKAFEQPGSSPAPLPTISTTTPFAPSIGQLGDPSSVASDVLLVINGHHVAVSQNLAAFYSRRKSWLARLFPSALDRVIADAQLRQAKTECDLNERLLALATDMKYESCREVGDAWVKSLKVGVREQFTGFVTERYEAMKNTIEARRVKFGDYMRERYRTLESYGDLPELASGYRGSMDREIEQYFDWLDQLLASFRSVIDEKVGEYARPSLPSK